MNESAAPASPSSPGPPKVSVIVGAYRRERYLPAALESVLAQTVPRESFELVVTKNFRSESLDRAILKAGAISLVDDDPHIGPWLSRAVGRSHAPLVAFLDDDDEWERDRLQRVLAVWEAHPDLGYYRNRVVVVDEAGSPVPRQRWGTHEIEAALNSAGPLWVPGKEKVAHLAEVKRLHPLFNSSSIVVRRELFNGELGERFRETQNPDPFLFLAGVVAPFGLYFDDRRLTRYRRHPGNITKTVWATRHGFEDSRRLADLAERLAPREYADWLRARSVRIERRLWTESIAGAVSENAPRRLVASQAAGYVRFLRQHPSERGTGAATWAALAYAGAYLTLPGFIARVRRAAARVRA